jgi:spermidine/putrescine transport system substrate-binding protein
MLYFDDDVSVDVNQMWINVRCYNLASMPMAAKIAFIAVLLIVVGYLIKAIYNGRKYNG